MKSNILLLLPQTKSRYGEGDFSRKRALHIEGKFHAIHNRQRCSADIYH